MLTFLSGVLSPLIVVGAHGIEDPSRSASGKSRRTSWPTASSLVMPNMCSAAVLKIVTIASVSNTTIDPWRT